MALRSRSRPFGGGAARHRAAAAVCLALLALPAGAQDRAAEAGGLSLGLTLSQDLRHRSNPGLAIPAAEAQTRGRTRLAFDLSSETAGQRLDLRLDGALASGDGARDGIDSPRAELSWRHVAAAAAVEAQIFLRESGVDTEDPDAGPEDPVADPASGEGTRRRTGGTLGFEVGRSAPVGATLSFGLTDTDYSGTTDPGLVDGRRTTARAALRLDLDAATRLTASASAARLEETGAAARDTLGFGLELTRDLPAGRIGAEMRVTRTEEGSRESLGLVRSFDLPAGGLTLRLGGSTTVTAAGALVTGGLDWTRELAAGRVSLGLDRRVTGSERDEERVVSRLALALDHGLGARLAGQLTLGLQESRTPGTASATRSADVTAQLRYGLSETTSLDLGATRRLRDTGGATAGSTDVFLTLSRRFDWQP